MSGIKRPLGAQQALNQATANQANNTQTSTQTNTSSATSDTSRKRVHESVSSAQNQAEATPAINSAQNNSVQINPEYTAYLALPLLQQAQRQMPSPLISVTETGPNTTETQNTQPPKKHQHKHPLWSNHPLLNLNQAAAAC